MGRKLFSGPLSLMLTLITLIFLISFVVAQAPAPAPAPAAAPAPAPAPAPKAKEEKKPAKEKTKEAAKGKEANAKDAKGKDVAKDAAKDAKAKDAKATKAPAVAPAVPKVAPAVPAPAAPPATDSVDPNLAKECNDCWTDKRSELPACKGITKEEFATFNKSPSSPKIASCLCMFANGMASVFENDCSALCVDQKLITELNSQATNFKTNYKCDNKGNSILGSSNLSTDGTGNQTASAVTNNINGNNMLLGLSFVMGMTSFLFFS